MIRYILISLTLMAISQPVPAATAGDGLVLGKFIEDPPTLICLGFTWDIEGDDNRNATADVAYRKKGESEWKSALPLLRTGAFHVGRASDWLDHVPPHRLAGSILDLEPDTEYEVRITAKDPDGVQGEAKKELTMRTRGEPQAAESGKVYHVYPPGKQANWTKNEFNNLYKAYYGGVGNLGDFNMVWERIVKPGDTVVVHAGVYKADRDHYTDPTGLVSDGTYWLTAKGTPEEPIVIKAAGDGEVIFDGAGADVLFNVMAADYHIFEGLTFRNCGYALFAGQQRVTGCVGLTVRNCRFENVRDGIFTLYNGSRNFYIADNVFLGGNARDGLTGWGGPEDGYLKSNTAVTLQGAGHVVCRNAIAYFWQAYHMGTAYQGRDCGGVACDVYNNDLFMLIDDGVEVDGCVRNVRVLRNRIVDTGSPISAQPVYGGPAYFIRNVSYHARCSLKFHEAYPSGLLVYHNTMAGNRVVPRGTYTNAHFRNNLFLAPLDTLIPAAFPSQGNGVTTDYNGFDSKTVFQITRIDGVAPIMDRLRDPQWPLKKYPGKEATTKYESLAEFRKGTGHEAHGMTIDYGVFKNLGPCEATTWKKSIGVHDSSQLNFSLRPNSMPVDGGVLLANVNDGYSGRAPDLGAHETGQPIPHYGPPSWTGEGFSKTLAPKAQE